MLPNYIRDKLIVCASSFLLILGLVFVPAYSQSSSATTAPASTAAPAITPSGISSQISSLSPETILTNIQNTVPNLMRMVTAIAFVIGIYMVIMGIIKLKHVGEMRTQMSHEHHLSGPILQIAIGSMLIYLPSTVQVGMSTFWTNPNPYGYVIATDQWMQFINVCFVVVQFIGVLAFIRGLVLLSHVGGGGGHQGALSKGLTHVVGGIFCINIYQFLQVILATIGINS